MLINCVHFSDTHVYNYLSRAPRAEQEKPLIYDVTLFAQDVKLNFTEYVAYNHVVT